MVRFSDFFRKLAGNAFPRAKSAAVSKPAAFSRRSSSLIGLNDDEAAFRFPASENMVADQVNERLLKVIQAFSPSQPTQDRSQFAGRLDVLTNVIAAIEEHRYHVVLFGGRGTGKTSLALALASNARRVGYHSAYVSCGRECTLDLIFRSSLSELPIRFDRFFDPRDPDADPTLTFDALLPEEPLSPQIVVDLLARIRGTRLLIILDEFDRNENASLTRDITEIMKVVSDRNIAAQIVIVGVGDIADSLVGEHSSVARVLYAVRLTNMTDSQIRDTLALASGYAGVGLSPAVVDAIVAISFGRPYIARLVGLKAAKIAVMNNVSEARLADLETGVQELIENLTLAGFGQASRVVMNSPSYIPFFLAMLGCKRDSADRFTVADVEAALSESEGQDHSNLAVKRAIEIISSSEVGLLSVSGTSPKMYQFADPRAELCVAALCRQTLNAKPPAAAATRKRDEAAVHRDRTAATPPL